MLKYFMGPCVVESHKTMMEIGHFLFDMKQKYGVEIILKASFDKANRTSSDSYRGNNLQAGVNLLAEVGGKWSLPTITDVHLPDQVERVASRIDWIQIPAMLMRQTDLVESAARWADNILVKKSQSAPAASMVNVLNKIRSISSKVPVVLCERGSTYGGNGDLVVDYRSLGIMRDFAPVCFDATHSVQQMSSQGKTSGGQRQFALALAKAGIATGWVDYIFAEIHPRPEEALSDSALVLDFAQAEELISTTKKIWEMSK